MVFGLDRAPQRRVFAAFFLYSFGLGGINPRLGDIQLSMGIGEATLGLALIGGAIGTQVSLMFAGRLLEKLGERRSLLLGIPMVALMIASVSLAPNPYMMFLAMFLAGLAIGCVEIVLNVEADRVEYQIGKRVMNRSHAFWSFGFFAAGAVSAVAKALDVDFRLHLFGMALVIIILSTLVNWDFKPAPKRVVEEGERPRFVRPTGAILVLVAFTLSAMLLEGAGSDWSVIFMRDTFDTTPFINATAFVFGAFFQAITRFFADGFIERFGPVRVARILLTTLGVGVCAVTFSTHPAVALLGFALMGIGTSAIFPLAVSAAAQRTDRPAAVNVAALAQISFITFLVAPPMLGFVAEHISIRHSFGIGIPLVILSFLTIGALRPRAGIAEKAKANA
ncbi:MAG: MFS transporter [Alphaproteobacteria bacterium]|nr:MFS transporter [Alphaproteobacteria bacterium]